MAAIMRNDRIEKADIATLLIYLNNQQDMLHALLAHARPSLTLPRPPPSSAPIQVRARSPAVRLEMDVDAQGRSLDFYWNEMGRGGGGDMERRCERVMLKPEVKDWKEVRPRVMRMRDEAFRALSVPATPRIPYFSRPAPLVPMIITLAIALQLYLFFAPAHLFLPGVHSPEPFGLTVGRAREAIASVGSEWLLPGSVVFLGVMHVGEAIYMALQCAKHSTPPNEALKWTYSTLIWGFPIFEEFWRCVQYERIRAIQAGKKRA